MTKLDDDPGEILTVGRLHTDIAEQLLIAGVEDHETSARRIVEEATGIEVELLPLEKDQQPRPYVLRGLAPLEETYN